MAMVIKRVVRKDVVERTRAELLDEMKEAMWRDVWKDAIDVAGLVELEERDLGDGEVEVLARSL